jgi:hypothetical protein
MFAGDAGDTAETLGFAVVSAGLLAVVLAVSAACAGREQSCRRGSEDGIFLADIAPSHF